MCGRARRVVTGAFGVCVFVCACCGNKGRTGKKRRRRRRHRRRRQRARDADSARERGGTSRRAQKAAAAAPRYTHALGYRSHTQTHTHTQVPAGYLAACPERGSRARAQRHQLPTCSGTRTAHPVLPSSAMSAEAAAGGSGAGFDAKTVATVQKLPLMTVRRSRGGRDTSQAIVVVVRSPARRATPQTHAYNNNNNRRRRARATPRTSGRRGSSRCVSGPRWGS